MRKHTKLIIGISLMLFTTYQNSVHRDNNKNNLILDQQISLIVEKNDHVLNELPTKEIAKNENLKSILLQVLFIIVAATGISLILVVIIYIFLIKPLQIDSIYTDIILGLVCPFVANFLVFKFCKTELLDKSDEVKCVLNWTMFFIAFLYLSEKIIGFITLYKDVYWVQAFLGEKGFWGIPLTVLLYRCLLEYYVLKESYLSKEKIYKF